MSDTKNSLITNTDLCDSQTRPLSFAETSVRILVIILLLAFLSPPLQAEERGGEFDGNGLVCRRNDTYFSRPYYFIFTNQTVLGPWVTIDTPATLTNLLESKYHSTPSVVRWADHTLVRETLRLTSHIDARHKQNYRCEIMDLKYMNQVIQIKDGKLQHESDAQY